MGFEGEHLASFEERSTERLAAIALRLRERAAARRARLAAEVNQAARLLAAAELLEDREALDELAQIRGELCRQLAALEQGLELVGAAEGAAEEETVAAMPEALVAPQEGGAAEGASAAPAHEEGGSPPPPHEEGAASGMRRALHAAPAWEPRPLEALEAERNALAKALEALPREGSAALAQFKSLACRFRAAQEERQRHSGSQGAWHQLLHRFYTLQRQVWLDVYCIPLVPSVLLTPADWQALARLYEEFARAEEVLAWVEAAAERVSGSWPLQEGAQLLEACGARALRLQRWLARHLPSQRDGQARVFRERLGRLASRGQTQLPAVHSEPGDSKLEALAAKLEAQFEEVQRSVSRRERQQEALAGFHQLLAEQDFGQKEGDDDRLCTAATACLEAGIPPTDRRLRDPLAEQECAWMLEEEPALAKLLEAVQEERERREREASSAEDEEDAPERKMPAMLCAMRDELRVRLRGKRGVIIGGRCREDNRRAIQQAFELAELRWPDVEPSDTFEASAREIERADIVWLTRFNRRRARAAFHLCNEQGKPLIVLPKGYGLHQVIIRTSDWFVRR